MPRPKSLESRNIILNTAIGFFASHGFHGSPLREIAKSAGVALSSVHYYFDSKEALFAECFRTIYQPLTERRDYALAQAQKKKDLSLETILNAFIEPLFLICLEPEGPVFIKLQSRLLEDPTIASRLQSEVVVAAERFLVPIRAALKTADEDYLLRAYRSLVWSTTFAPFDPLFAAMANRPATPKTRAEVRKLTDQMVRLFAAGFRA